MRIAPYQRQQVQPSSAGGALVSGAGTADAGAAAGLGVLGQTVGAVAQAQAELAARQRASERATTLERVSLDYKLAFSNWANARTKDPTAYKTLETDALQVRKQLREEAAKATFGDPELQSALDLKLDEFDGMRDIELRNTANKQMGAMARGVLEANLHDSAQLYAGAGDVERTQIMRGTLETIRAQVAAGFITQEDGVKRAQQWASDVEATDIAMQMRNPGQIRDLQADLLDGSTYPNIDPDTRTTLLAQVDRLIEQDDRERIRLAEKAERDGERLRKQGQAANAAQYRLAIMSTDGVPVGEGDLARAVETGQITLRQFDYLIASMKAEREGVDDPDTVVRLSRDVSTGLVSEDEIMGHHAGGRLSKTTANSLLTKASQARAGGGILSSEDVQRQRDYVDHMVGGIRGPMAILDPQESQRVAAALRDYDAEIIAAYEASRAGGKPFDPRAIADKYVALYRPDTEIELSAMRKPRFAGDVPRDQVNIAAAKQATMQALMAGEITAAEAASEAALLREYERLLTPTPVQNSGRPANR